MALPTGPFTGPSYQNASDQIAEETRKKRQAAAIPAAEPQKAKETQTPKKIDNPLTGKTPKIDLGSDALNIIVDAPTNLVEGVLNRGELIKDSVGVGINNLRGIKTPSKDNPWSDEYVEASYDLGVQGPKSDIGKLAGGILTFALGAKLLGKASRLKTGGIAGGALSDFVLTKPEDGTLSTLVRDQDWIPPEMEDTFMLALAAKSDDNAWVAKFKAIAEGGVLGKVGDAAVWGFKSIRAGRAAKAAGKSDAQALEIAGQVAKSAQKEVDVVSAKNSLTESDRWDAYNANRFNTLRDKEEGLNQSVSKLGETFGEDSAEYLDGLKSLEDVQKEINDFDWAEMRRSDPSGLAPHEKAAYKDTVDINDAAAAQLRLENNSVPDAAKVNPRFQGDATSPTMGSSPSVTTDAFHKTLAEGGMTPEVNQMLRDFTKREDIVRIAKAAGRSVKQVVDDSAKIVMEVRDALQPHKYQGESILDILGGVKSAKTLSKVDGETMLSPEGIVAAKALITDTSNQIFNLSLNLDQMSQIRMAGGNQYDRLVDRLTGLLELHKHYASDKGFGLRVMQELPFGRVAGDASAANIKTATTLTEMKNWGEKIKRLARDGDPAAQQELDSMVRAMVLAGGDPTKAVKFMDLGLRVGWDSLMKAMYSSMLSGPITHVRNAVGNTYALMERPLSIYLDGLFSGDKDKTAAATAGFYAIRTSVSDAFDVFNQTLRTGEPVQVNRKFVLDDAKTQVDLQMMKMAAKSDGEQRAVSIVEMIYNFHNNGFISFPSRMLMASDDFFKHLNARQKVATDAMYKAVRESNSPNDIEGTFKRYLNEYSKKIDPNNGEILDNDLLEYVQRATFQNDPGSAVGKIALALGEIPLLKIFVPFVRTPINILNYTAEHTPMLNRASENYRVVMEGSDELLKAEMRGREAIGKATILSVGMLSMSGLITGNGPTDLEQRKIWMKSNQPMSIRVGDTWVSYQTLEPLATIAAIVADAGMLAQMGGQTWAEKIIGQMTYSIMAACTEKSFLAGLSNLTMALDPKNITDENKIINGMLNTANNFLPYAGARRSLANTLDPYVKEVDGELQRALNIAVPFYKNSQPSMTDVFTGELTEVAGGGIWNANSPFRIRAVNKDPVVDKLADMQFEYNQMTKNGPEGIALTAPEQALYSKYMYQTGFHKDLQTMFKQDWFNESLTAYKDRPGLLDKKSMRHYQATQMVVDQAKRIAFDKMLAENTDVYQRIGAVKTSKYYASQGQVKPAIESLLKF